MLRVKKPQWTVALENLRQIAIAGSEQSLWFDAGIMSVVREVEENGIMVRRQLGVLIGLACDPTRLSTEERCTADHLRTLLGCSVTDGGQYARGVACAESALDAVGVTFQPGPGES